MSSQVRQQNKKIQLQRKLAARELTRAAETRTREWLMNGTTAMFFMQNQYVFHFEVINNTPVLGATSGGGSDVCEADKKAARIIGEYCSGANIPFGYLMEKIVQGMWDPRLLTEPARIVIKGSDFTEELIFDEMMYMDRARVTTHLVGHPAAECPFDPDEFMAGFMAERKK